MRNVHYTVPGPPTQVDNTILVGSVRPRYGGNSGGETPGDVYKRQAKPSSADGTAPARVWESRTPPNSFRLRPAARSRPEVVFGRYQVGLGILRRVTSNATEDMMASDNERSENFDGEAPKRSREADGTGAAREYRPRQDRASGQDDRPYSARRDSSGASRDSAPYSGDRPQRSYGDRPQRSGDDRTRRPYEGGGDRPQRSYGDRPQRSGDDRPQRSGDDRPRRPHEGGGDRPQRSGDDRPQRSYGDRQQRSGDDRPQRSGDDRPQRSGDDRPQRSGDDRPQRS